MNAHPGSAFAFDTPDAAIDAVRARLSPVGTLQLSLSEAVGHVLAEPVRADRDSPPCDVSAMDGYAVRTSDLRIGRLPVRAESRIGVAPPPMPIEGAVKIATGAPIPAGADLVIRREAVDESDPASLVLRIDPRELPPGQHIRRKGENLAAGSLAVEPGMPITPATVALLAGFGITTVTVHRPVSVAILTTGDELIPAQAVPTDYQVRDSNGPALHALFSGARWIAASSAHHAADSPDQLQRELQLLLDRADAVVLTGGVSMGDRDFVPAIVASTGADTIFHKLPVRPGKPVFAAVTPAKKPIVGLPGNPVSALVGAVRLVAPLLRHLAGFQQVSHPLGAVRLTDPDDATLNLWWWRLVRFERDGAATLLSTRGSGDLVSAARSDGFIELPPGASGAGPWAAYHWEI